MNSEGGQSSGQLDVLHLGVDLRRGHQLLVFHEDLLLDLVRPDVRLRQELLEAGSCKVTFLEAAAGAQT